MNGNFRKPEFVKRYEYNYYDLETPLNSNVANNARQIKNNYRFEVDNSSEANPIDWYNAYLEVDFKLVKTACWQQLLQIEAQQQMAKHSSKKTSGGITVYNNTRANDQLIFCTTTNGQTFIKEIQVECNGITVYNNTRANESANILSMLKITKIHENIKNWGLCRHRWKRSIFLCGRHTYHQQELQNHERTYGSSLERALYNEGFAKRKTLTDAAAVNNISIPLNLYSYFAAFKNNLHPNLKTNIKLTLENDDNIIFKITLQRQIQKLFSRCCACGSQK